MLGFLFAGYLALVGRPLEAVNDRLQPISPPPNPALDRAQAARPVFGMLTLASVLTGFHGPSASAGTLAGSVALPGVAAAGSFLQGSLGDAQIMTFENLPPAEQIRYCRDKLARLDELETQVRSMPSTQQNRETLRDLATARGEYIKALKRLENPSLWQRTNRWVNEWAAEDRAKEAARKRQRGCTSCNGTGQVTGAGNWFESCRSCDGTGEYREYREYL